MKKLIIPLLLCFYIFSYSQRNDTIFFKTGKILPVYRINKVFDGIIYCVYKAGEDESIIDKDDVERYIKSNKVCTIEDIYYENNKGKSEIDYKTGWIQYNLSKYYKEERASQIIYGLSLASSVVYIAKPLKNTAFMYVAGGLGLVGFIIHLDSYKWIHRASIETALNGITLKVKL